MPYEIVLMHMSESKKSKNINSYAKYSGLAVQLLVILFIATWLGKKVDARWGGDNQYFTALLLVTVLVAYFYKLYRELERDRKK